MSKLPDSDVKEPKYRLTGINEWWLVYVQTQGFVAAFKALIDAQDYADALRDAIGEARGLTSAVSVFQNQ